MLSKVKSLIPPIILLLLVITPFWKVAMMKGVIITDDIFASDLMNDRFPCRFILGEALREGHLPLWTSYIYNGFPLLAQVEVGACYPFNLLFFGLLPAHWALNMSILFHFFLAGLFFYFLSRVLGLPSSASLFGSIAFMYSGFFIAHVKHMNMVDAAVYVPLLLTFLELAFQKGKIIYLILMGLIFGVQILAGHPQISYYTLLFLGCYFLYRMGGSFWKRDRELKKRGRGLPLSSLKITGYFLFFLVLGICLGAIQILPTIELVGFSERAGGVSFQFAEDYPFYLGDLLNFIYPYTNGDPGKGTYLAPSIFWENYGYLGLLPLIFALLAPILAWKKQGFTKFFFLSFLLTLLLALGPNTPLFKSAFYLIPGMRYFRFPTRFLLFTELSLAILASIGFSHLLSKLRSGLSKQGKLRANILIGLGLTLTFFDLWHYQMRQNPVVDWEKWSSPPETVKFLKADRSLFWIFTVGESESHKLAYIKAGGWEEDLTPYIEQREFLQPSSNMLYKISSVTGYVNLVPRHIIKMWGNEKRPGLVQKTAFLSEDQKRLLVTPAFLNFLSLFNVKYLLSLWPIEHPVLKLKLKKENLSLYENTKVMSRVFLVSQAFFVPDEEKAGRILLSEAFDPSRTALLMEGSRKPLESDPQKLASSELEILTYSSQEVLIKANLKSSGVLVLSDTWYPGWKVYIDGKEGKILRANICQRAVLLQEGERTIRFLYRPQSFQWGTWITGLSFFLLVFFLLLCGNRRFSVSQSCFHLSLSGIA